MATIAATATTIGGQRSHFQRESHVPTTCAAGTEAAARIMNPAKIAVASRPSRATDACRSKSLPSIANWIGAHAAENTVALAHHGVATTRTHAPIASAESAPRPSVQAISKASCAARRPGPPGARGTPIAMQTTDVSASSAKPANVPSAADVPGDSSRGGSTR